MLLLEILPCKLMAGRFHYWATGISLGQALLKQQGLDGKIVPLFVYKEVDMYLACNPQMGEISANEWNHILNEMQIDGTNARIEAKYH